MELNGKTKPVHRERMPFQIILALIALLFSVALSAFLAFMLWIEHTDRLEHNQETSIAPMALVAAGAAINLVLTVLIAMRFNWARVATAVFCVIAILFSLYNAFASGLGFGAALPGLAINIGVIVALMSEPAREYCYRGTRPE